MIEPAQFHRIASVLPVLQRADPQLAREFAQAAWLARIPAGRDVFVEGDRTPVIRAASGLCGFKTEGEPAQALNPRPAEATATARSVGRKREGDFSARFVPAAMRRKSGRN